MVRLTAELISTSPSFVNTLKERELDLRGNKIAQIENLGATEDQYDVLDFSDNDITRLEGFPFLQRLSTVLLNSNRVATIETGLGAKIPNLERLILTNNRLENLADLDPLSEFKKLHTLSLLRNPVTKLKHYRFYILHKIPNLKILDFQKVTNKEREEAVKLFGGEAGSQLAASITKTKAIPTAPITTSGTALTMEQKEKLKDIIISKTSTLEEVQRLERALQSGKVPKSLEKELANTNVTANATTNATTNTSTNTNATTNTNTTNTNANMNTTNTNTTNTNTTNTNTTNTNTNENTNGSNSEGTTAT